MILSEGNILLSYDHIIFTPFSSVSSNFEHVLAGWDEVTIFNKNA